MKRLLKSILSLSVVLSLLAGCSDDESNDQKSNTDNKQTEFERPKEEKYKSEVTGDAPHDGEVKRK